MGRRHQTRRTTLDKILSEYRRPLGEFEIVDFKSDDPIEQLREQLDVDIAVNLHWTWSYGSEMEEMRRLYEKGKGGQWNAQTDLDWDTPFTKDEWMINPEGSMMAAICQMMGKDEATQKAAAFDEIGYNLSQLLHGEQAALQLCGQLTNVCPEMDQKFYAASQVIDEARHIEVFAKFLTEKVGTIYPIGGGLKTLLEILLKAEGVQKKVLGMQTLFEGMAVGIMDMMRDESRNSLMSTMLHRVAQDEARHAAFGVLNMRRIVKEASVEHMQEMEDWAFGILETLNADQQLEMLRTIGPKYDLDPEAIVAMTTTLPNFAELNSPIYMHTVVPNLRNLGLITDRTEDQWRRVGMIYDA
jgi:hypothetical protein